MQPDFSKLDDALDDAGADGFLIYASSDDSNQRYLSGFDAPDPFMALYDGAVHLHVSPLEYGRAKKESGAASLSRPSDFGYRELVEEHGRIGASHRVHARFLESHDVESVLVPMDFPVGKADGLREQGIAVTADEDDILKDIRAVKLPQEIAHVRAAQKANEQAMHTAEMLIREATVEDGVLHYEGEPLTSERVRQEIELTLLRHGCALDETIVACGADAADPHDRGSGPLLANESIIVDIFPRDKESKYFADMTRTFVKGTPSDELQAWYDISDEALEAALDAVKPGVTGEEIHNVVCDIYEEAGYPTLRSDETTEVGFIHSTGHGVGLDIHEWPALAPQGYELEEGHIITVEPGLYDPEVGGVRIEDIVVVTEDGYENLTDYPKEFVLP
ncbi:Xaa-Pro peptidase family protein [Haladaptatus sp. YSMS36]|uniref:M24 family metallopeptidase n=1 Tax=Haladaptatus sp. YSMS36 TaxID=3033384 RepID=UPI0023E8DB39|nr:Xaa-Pro peptidase family protein [Haladaptatus sp. YSMS36]